MGTAAGNRSFWLIAVAGVCAYLALAEPLFSSLPLAHVLFIPFGNVLVAAVFFMVLAAAVVRLARRRRASGASVGDYAVVALVLLPWFMYVALGTADSGLRPEPSAG